MKRATCSFCKRTREYHKGNPDQIRFAKNEGKTIWKCSCGNWSVWAPKNIRQLGNFSSDLPGGKE